MNKDNSNLDKVDFNHFEEDESLELQRQLFEAGDIFTFMKEHDGHYQDVTFKTFLEHLLETKALKKPDVIKASGIGESYAYQIFSGKKNPSRDKLLALAVGMRLTIDECRRFLYLAGVNQLNPKNRRDAAILLGVQKGASVFVINDTLAELNEHMIG